MRDNWAGLYILDDNDQPVPCYDTLAWARWFETANRRICADYDEGDSGRRVLVSTVFLGVDHAFGGGPPVLWETMAFIDRDDVLQYRYSSLEAAILGHQKACEEVMLLLKAEEKGKPHG